MQNPLKTFIIYARKDASFKDDLVAHLYPLVNSGLIEKWVDSDLLAGEDWERRIEKELDQAHLILMLVSADALKSDFIQNKELKKALEKKSSGKARVVPILVRDCMWELQTGLSEIQILPKDEYGKVRGVAAWQSPDLAWTSCCRELLKLIEEIRYNIEKEAIEVAKQAEKDTRVMQEEAEKLERTRHKRDEAAWKRIEGDVARAEEYEQKILFYETYLADLSFRNHREEAEEKIEEIRADIEAERKVIAARKAAEERRRRALLEESLKKPEMPSLAPAEYDTVAILYPEMVKVQGGMYMMGDEHGDLSEHCRPVHKVTVSDFEIGKFPVTQRLWIEVMGENPAHFKGDENRPVENVSWGDVQVFLARLNERYPDQNYRLPTEAEWEYAARGGNQSKGYRYAGGNVLHEVGWFWENSGDTALSGNWSEAKITENRCRTHPVGLKKPNELGIYDMSGNVWEWCSDYYELYSTDTQANPAGPQTGINHVFRGGSWRRGHAFCRVAHRYWMEDTRRNMLGFRLARSL